MSQPAAATPGPTPDPAPGQEPSPTRPGPYLLAAAVVVASSLVAVAVAVPWLLGQTRPADLTAVDAHDDLPLDHVEGRVDYPTSPPVGGPHASAWLACGVYDAPVPAENAVHSLEPFASCEGGVDGTGRVPDPGQAA